jgi:hypothetical protein
VLSRYRLAPVSASLSMSQGSAENLRGWNLLRVLEEKDVLTASERRAWRSFLHYEQARDNLFHRDAPFRGALLRSILGGRPPLRAVAILSLSFLPAGVLRPLLLRAQRVLASQVVKRAQRLGSSG